ncbi:hypothetical protein J4471_02765 [Candidatus Woesearchaeota archaeon]|nr:hypothetical protein [Candidatus Woesearchaeota archaeon]
MSKTIKTLKEMKKAIKEDVSNTVAQIKDKTLDASAEIIGRVKQKGGLAKVVEESIQKTASTIGGAVGKAGKASKAAYETLAGFDEKKHPEINQGEYLVDKINALYHALQNDFRNNYIPSTLDKAIESKFQEAAKYGSKGVNLLNSRIHAARDDIANKMSGHIPNEDEYKMHIGNHVIELDKNIYTKRKIEQVKQYIRDIKARLPVNYPRKVEVFRTIGKAGITTNTELMAKQPQLYLAIQKYLRIPLSY